MAVLGADREPLPLAEEREVGRLLQLGDEHACAESVRKAGGHVDDVAGAHARPGSACRAAHPCPALGSAGDSPPPRSSRAGRPTPPPTSPRVATTTHASVFPNGDPSTSRANARSGMRVHRQPLRGVEELDEKPRGRAVARNVRVAEPRRRICRDDVAQEAAVREPRQPLERIVPTRVVRRGHRADPVLRCFAILLQLSPQPADQRATAVEAIDARGGERLGVQVSGPTGPAAGGRSCRASPRARRITPVTT